MKVAIVLAVLIASALALPARQKRQSDATILKYENDNIGIDGYNFAFETSDGTSRDESAVVNNLGSENEEIVVRGSFTFLGDDGQTYTVTYVADKNGFQPSAPHIPAA